MKPAMADIVRSLEARLRRLEKIVASLEREDLELEQALALFEEGVGELREAEKTLRETELRVERLLEERDGQPVLERMRREAE
jgi:exodeoxyribonuclease VII small subunit